METVWYLWAVNDDPATNEYLVQIIGEQNQEELQKDKLCADGVKRNLFRCPRGHDNVKSALAARAEFNLKLEVFVETTEGKISNWVLWKPSVKKAARLANSLLNPRHGS